MITAVVFTIACIIGYVISLQVSHPLRKSAKLPLIRIKNIEVLPNFRVHFRNKTYHFHHWMYLSILIGISLVIYEGFFHNLVLLKGAAIGGIIQGLRYPDRFSIRKPRRFY